MSFEEKPEDLLKLLQQQLPQRRDTGEFRCLSVEEIQQLEQAGNSCPDWSGVTVTSRTRLSLIQRCRLLPPLRIDLQAEEVEVDGERFSSVLRGTTIASCTILGPVHADSIGELRGLTVIGPVALVRCGSITASDDDRFGIGSPLELGVETGERDLPLIPTLTPELAHLLTSGKGAGLRSAFGAAEAAAVESLGSMEATIGPGCILRDTPAVEGCFLTGHVTVDCATAVRDSFLMGAPDRRTTVCDGALVRSSALQWGARVDSLAMVQGSLVGECSTVERHAKLTASLLGPDSCLGEGEITASLTGPFTAMHHQSLLIAARWPLGQGNIGYGANVGSNHTSRAPDQELECGQGCFFGLGCSIKFPCSMADAPFTIVATGVTALPQRLEMPFSLICGPTQAWEGVSPALNELRPGWVLSANLYSLWRSMRKYQSRMRAVVTGTAHPVLSAANARLVERARARLMDVSGDGPWTDVDGIGKNVLTERARTDGVRAYDLFLSWYALDAFISSLRKTADPAEAMATMPAHQRSVLEGHLGCSNGLQASRRWLQVAAELQRRLRRSREKDGDRGGRTIADYRMMHDGADAVLKDAEETFALARKLVLGHFPDLR